MVLLHHGEIDVVGQRGLRLVAKGLPDGSELGRRGEQKGLLSRCRSRHGVKFHLKGPAEEFRQAFGKGR